MRHFGYWPDFHDWEVLELRLRRDEPSHIVLQRPGNTREAVIVELRNVLDVELTDFSAQNVVGAVSFEEKDGGWRMTLWPIYGINGYIDAAAVTISIRA